MFTSCNYFGPIKVIKGWKKADSETFWSAIHMPWLESHSTELATDASTMEFLRVLRKSFSYRAYPKVMISYNGGSRARTTPQDWRFGQNQAQRILHRQGYEMAVPLPPLPHTTMDVLNRCQDDKVSPKENHWSRAHVLRAVYLLTWSGKSSEWTTNWQNPKWSRRWGLSLSTRHLVGQSHRFPQGPFRHTDNPRHRVEFCSKIVDSFWQR